MQIGPKIRVGGTLGHLGQQLKIGLGKAEKAAAPFVAMIPGVGQIAAPILNTAGNIFDTSNGGIHNIGQVGKIALNDALLAIPGASQSGGPVSSVLNKIPGYSTMASSMGGYNPFGSTGTAATGTAAAAPGMSTMDKWQIGSQLASGLLNGLGQYQQSQTNKDISKAQLAEQAKEFAMNYGLTAGQNGIATARSLDLAPLRDKAAFMLNQAMGQTPGQYTPGSMNYGYNRQALQTANTAYQPNMGGTKGSQDIMKMFLQQLGYRAPSTGMTG